MRAHGVGRLQHFQEPGQLARKHDRAAEEWDYRFHSEMVHRPDLAGMFRTRTPASDALHIYLRNDNPDFRAAVLASGMASALQAHKAVASMLGWDETTSQVDELLTEVDALFPEPDDPEAERWVIRPPRLHSSLPGAADERSLQAAVELV